jgi:hypothetical protein
VTVTPVNDTLIETDEQVTLTLAAGAGYTLGAPTLATGTITDNDTPVITVAATDAAGAEQASNTIVFTVTRSGNTTVSTAVTLAWNGSATLTADYTVGVTGATISANRLLLTFGVGQTVAILTVTPVNDTVVEVGGETVSLDLAPGAGYTVGGTGSASGTIADNDTGVSVTVTDGIGAETGPNPIVFTVTRTGITTGTTNVTLAWSGSATLTTDYTVGVTGAAISANRLTLTFAAGQTVATVTLTPVNDTAIEPQETVALTLAAGTGYTVVAPASASGTIDDNDTPVISVVASDAAGAEQASNTVVFTVTRSGNAAVSTAVTLAWGGSATLTTDYTVAATGATISANRLLLTFAAGQSVATVTVTPVDDAAVEAQETVTLSLVAGTGYTIDALASSASGAIDDNDVPLPAVSVTTPDSVGAEQLAETITFTVTLSAAAASPVVVNLTWTGSATLTTDYTVGATGATISANRLQLTFAAGQTVATVTVTPVDDAVVEAAETVILTIAAGSGYTGAGASGSATINDNDVAPPLPTVNVSSIAVDEGNKKNGTTANVIVSLSAASATTVTVVVTTVDNTATAGSDYTAVTRTLTFAAGVTSQTFAVSISGDTTVEPSETLVVRVTSVSAGATGAGNQGVVTIVNDDGALVATAVGPASETGPALTASAAGAALREAVGLWIQAGADPNLLAAITLMVEDLGLLQLGQARGTTILLDDDAAGWGWLVASAGWSDAGRIDLLTVVLHEVGHVLGLEHVETGVMDAQLAPGERRLQPGGPESAPLPVAPYVPSLCCGQVLSRTIAAPAPSGIIGSPGLRIRLAQRPRPVVLGRVESRSRLLARR